MAGWVRVSLWSLLILQRLSSYVRIYVKELTTPQKIKYDFSYEKNKNMLQDNWYFMTVNHMMMSY